MSFAARYPISFEEDELILVYIYRPEEKAISAEIAEEVSTYVKPQLDLTAAETKEIVISTCSQGNEK